MKRVRIKFHKTAAMRFSGHLDLFKTWERTLRRARLPLAYTQGFHPQPRLQLACALPLGFTSECEWIDIWLEADLPVEEIFAALESAQPPGIRIQSIAAVDLHAPALQNQVLAAEYWITLLEPIHDLEARLQTLLESERLPRQRRGKEYDLRPLIEALERLPDDEEGRPRLRARLAARPGATGRPEELIAALGLSPTLARYHRVALRLAQPEEVC